MNEERMLQILLAPQMSEKAVRLSAEGQYVFKVANDATKPEIRTAVEKLFSVEVKSVRVLNVRAELVLPPGSDGIPASSFARARCTSVASSRTMSTVQDS